MVRLLREPVIACPAPLAHPLPAHARGKPRNDQLDPYASFPIHQGRGARPKTDAFADAVQHTQSVARPLVSRLGHLARGCQRLQRA